MQTIIFEDLSCIGVLCVVGTIFAACLRVLWRANKSGWRNYRFKPREIVLLSVGAIGIGCIAYGALVEPLKLIVTHVAIHSGKIPPGKSVRIVQLSDIHSDGITRNEDRLPAVVTAQHPDIIVFCGDAANNPAGAKQFRACLTKLATIAPVFAVNGNHDSHVGRHWNLFDGIPNVTHLLCDAQSYTAHGVPLWFCGVGIDNERLMDQALRSAPPDTFSIFLYHYPIGIQSASKHKIDLMCAGHTHGGQVRLPLYGAVTTQSELGRAFASGLHRVGSTWLYINQGIGMTGTPVRFLCPPEVTVLDISP